MSYNLPIDYKNSWKETIDNVLIFLRDDGSIEAKERADKMRAVKKIYPRPYVQCKDNRLAEKLASFFQQKNKKPNNVGLEIEERPRSEQIEIEELPNVPALPQPARNPEYQAGTTINNYNFNFTCTIS